MILAWNPDFSFDYNDYVNRKNVVYGDDIENVRDMLKNNRNINMYRYETSLLINESNIKFEEESRVPPMPFKVITQGIYDVFPDYINAPDELSDFEFEQKNCSVAVSYLIGYHELDCSPGYVDKFLNVAFDKNARHNSFGIYDYVPFKLYIQFIEKKPNFEIKFKFQAGYLQSRDRNIVLSQDTILTENMIYRTGCFNVKDVEKKYKIPIKNI